MHGVHSIFDETGTLGEAELALIRAAADAAFDMEKKRGALALYCVTPEEIRALNLEHRAVDRVTDVLSFPAAEPGETPPDGFWGDIVLCPERAKEQAAEYGHSLTRELAFLTVHGALHLFGYDHMEKHEETYMLERQRAILERMGVPR
ncbi:MAG TPA: rRNA maturation RNase YbeY [Feifaniaceae bacterium]|nr:rRNA maturation RNase YbeY [Feifaniaceae bacterium]